MTTEEFGRFRDRVVADFAAEQVRAGTWQVTEAESLSRAGLDEQLPLGPDTAGQLVLTAEDDEGPIGALWLGLEHPRGVPDTAWIQDIDIAPSRRGHGFGRALLSAAEQLITERGISALGLNVFGANEVARNMYASAGYEVVTQQMRKQLL
jgi:GNAT superfamily N-acetyltransferase